ncbi:MAG: aspartate kinase, partial [Neolewinella sp.]
MLAQSLNVFKFGGASLKDAAAIRNVANILETYKGDRLVIVVSAMGKNTNALEMIARAYADGNVDTARHKLAEFHNATMAIVKELFGDAPE